jgi:uncharacterized protein YukE
MATFEVTPSELQSLASQLSGLLGELEAATGTVSSGAGGAAQNGPLESSIEGFLSDWSSSLQRLRTKLSEVAERLGAAGAGYESTDSDVAGHFTAA